MGKVRASASSSQPEREYLTACGVSTCNGAFRHGYHPEDGTLSPISHLG